MHCVGSYCIGVSQCTFKNFKFYVLLLKPQGNRKYGNPRSLIKTILIHSVNVQITDHVIFTEQALNHQQTHD